MLVQCFQIINAIASQSEDLAIFLQFLLSGTHQLFLAKWTISV